MVCGTMFVAAMVLSMSWTARAAEVARAVAYVAAKDPGLHPEVGGYVLFSQAYEASGDKAGLSGVTVDVSNLIIKGTGLAGVHGFHVHQFGDSALQCGEDGVSNCTAMVGGHFVPTCGMRRALDNCEIGQPCELQCDPSLADRDVCRCNEVHGLPPSWKRMPGDMGNLECDAQGSCKICFDKETGGKCEAIRVFEQEKLSLYEQHNSIVGRAVAVHQFLDNVTAGITSRGLGDAGPAIAYGSVGIISAGSDTNLAKAPTFPEPEKAVCIFRPNIGGALNLNGLKGKAIVSIDLRKKLLGEADYCSMRVEMTGLDAGTRSFHFHKYGDLRFSTNTDPQTIGPIFSTGKLEVKQWEATPDSEGKAIFETACTLGEVSELVGRSLTVHSGPDASSSTIAMAVCGLANPASCFYDSDKNGIRCSSAQPPVEDPGKSKVGAASASSVRTAAAALVVGAFGLLVQ
jgi:Cu/Zn superoxide dismutase